MQKYTETIAKMNGCILAYSVVVAIDIFFIKILLLLVFIS